MDATFLNKKKKINEQMKLMVSIIYGYNIKVMQDNKIIAFIVKQLLRRIHFDSYLNFVLRTKLN